MLRTEVFRRTDNQDLLKRAVCLQVSRYEDRHEDVRDELDLISTPTLVVLDPLGHEISRLKRAPDEVLDRALTKEPRRKAAVALREKRWADAARILHCLMTYFPGTYAAHDAARTHRGLANNASYMKAYEKVEAAHAKALASARKALNEKRAAARKAFGELIALRKKADALYRDKRYGSAFNVYRKIIWEYPNTPEADGARRILKRHHRRWREPKQSDARK